MISTWSRLIRFQDPDGNVHLGQPVDDKIDVGISALQGEVIKAYKIEGNNASDPNAKLTKDVLTVAKLLCPLTKDEVSGGLRCVGLQYTDHAKEMNFDIPTVPTMFIKPRGALNGPNAPIRVPPSAGHEIDYEVELVIVIGKDCKDVSEEQAMDYVLGYTVGNDVTARIHQRQSTQWSFCKSFDGFAPIGPCIVSSSTLKDPHAVSLKTQINDGPIVQDGKGEWAIFKFAKIISYLSQGSTLEAGSVIFTGTPAGIGASHKPPLWLVEKDTVKCTISHGLGTLVNTVEYMQT